MRIFYALALLLSFSTQSFAQEAQTIVEWYTLQATSNYTQQLEALSNGESLIVWVGYTNLKLFDQIKNAHNCYIETLPGVRRGIIIGEREENKVHIVAQLDVFNLTNEKVTNDLIKKYGQELTEKVPTLEEQLLGSGFITHKPVPVKKLLPPVIKKVVESVSYQRPVGHTHTCPICGNVWDHKKNPTHNCDRKGCRGVQFQQDPSPKMVPYFHRQLVEVN